MANKEHFSIISENLIPEEDPEVSSDSDKPEQQFAHLEGNYQKLMVMMCENPALSKYTDAYTAMFDYAYQLHIKSMNIAYESAQLKANLTETDCQIQAMEQIFIEDSIRIEGMKVDVTSAHRMLDTAHENEQAAMEVIDNLRHTINTLQNEIDFKNRMIVVDDLEENPTVAKHRQGLEREREKLIKEVAKMSEKFESAQAYQEDLEKRTDETDAQIHLIIGKLDEAIAELTKHRRLRERLEQNLQEYFDDIASKNHEIEELTVKNIADQRDIVKLDNNLKEKTGTTTKAMYDIAVWNQRFCKKQDDFNRLQYEYNTEKRENAKVVKKITLQEREYNSLKKDIRSRQKEKAKAAEKKQQLNAGVTQTNRDRNRIRSNITKYEIKIVDQKILNDVAKRSIVDRIREKDMINRNLIRQEAVTKETILSIDIQQIQRRKIETKIEALVEEQRQQRRHMIFLERERDRLKEDLIDRVAQMNDLFDEVKAQKVLLFDRKKKLSDSQKRLRMQQNLYEACKAEKVTLKKTLEENIIRTNEARNYLVEYMRTNELLKNEVFYKEQKVKESHEANVKMGELKDDMENELKRNQAEIHRLKEECTFHKQKTKDILRQIDVADFNLRESDKKIVMLMNERDILGAQLVARNEEIALLYKKLTLLKAMLDYGETKYRHRLNDLTLLKTEILRIRQEKTMSERKITNMNDFHAEVMNLEKDLITEQIKCKLLQAEMGNPINIHSWSKLEGSDPDMFQLMKMILIMQKRLLRQAKKTHERELQLKELSLLYKNTRKMVSKQPGPGIYAMIMKSKQRLKVGKEQSKYLERQSAIVADSVNFCSLQLHEVSLALRQERQKLLHEKKLRRNDMAKLILAKKKGQEIMDNMNQMLSKETVMKIALKPSEELLP